MIFSSRLIVDKLFHHCFSISFSFLFSLGRSVGRLVGWSLHVLSIPFAFARDSAFRPRGLARLLVVRPAAGSNKGLFPTVRRRVSTALLGKQTTVAVSFDMRNEHNFAGKYCNVRGKNQRASNFSSNVAVFALGEM